LFHGAASDRRNKTVRWPIALVVGALLLAAYALLVARAAYLRPYTRWEAATRRNLKIVNSALLVYRAKYGVFPANPRGGDHALYLVKDLLEGKGALLAAVPRPPEAGPQPAFDDQRAMVVNADFDYANSPRPPEDYDFILLAEKVLPGIKVRYYGMLDGQIIGVDPSQPWAREPLVGRRARDIYPEAVKRGPAPSGR
jgi:hypothetical protein